MAYKLVENEKELKIYNGIWEQVWKNEGYELEYSDGVVDKYLIEEDGQFIGTIEIKSYSDKSIINQYYPFIENGKIREFMDKTIEIDKVSIKEDCRKSGALKSSLSALKQYAIKNDVRYAIALMEPKFYRVCRLIGVPFEEIGGKFFYKGGNVVPVIIDAEKFKAVKLRLMNI